MVDVDTCWLPSQEIKSQNKIFYVTVIGGDIRSQTINSLCRKYLPRVEISEEITEETELVIATFSDLNHINHDRLANEGYEIQYHSGKIWIRSPDSRGLVYGFFHFMQYLQLGKDEKKIAAVEQPATDIRMINHWDNIDGSIERGYAGRSLFFENNHIDIDEDRIHFYAEMLASIGINSLTINNVNVNDKETYLIAEEKLPDVARIAEIFRGYGVQLFLSVNYASPMLLGGLDTADPLDSNVMEWWKKQTAMIYERIPDFGGFVVKADSEGRPGPFTYGRTHAEGANMLAEALFPYGGNVFWRCFVYNSLQDWRDRTTDRARAAYDHFIDLDGDFHENVILQIKNGPMDFQVREPVSPLFGALKQTNHVIEFQITQEYTGQQIDVCYLPKQWKETLDFDTFAQGKGSFVKHIVTNKIFELPKTGFTAVTNIGRDSNWTGHTFAQANLFGYGRLAWNPDNGERDILTEWTRLTFGHLQTEVQDTVWHILDESWEAYENYTSPLGVGWMVNTGHHYGPDINGYEFEPWGTYHFSDRYGLGVDRTRTGSNYVSQYKRENQERYENVETCPDELLLFFHHVPYTHRLKSGDTVIQHIYNTHFKGVEQVKGFIGKWEKQREHIPEGLYEHVYQKLQTQLENAIEWRDRINTYYYRMSGIDDEKKRKIYP